MFDDDAPQKNVAPTPATPASALPTPDEAGIPDMFDGASHEADGVDLSPESSMNGPSALAVGKLTPVSGAPSIGNPAAAAPPSMPSDFEKNVPPASQQENFDTEKSPSASTKIFLAVGIVVAIVAVVAGILWFMNRPAALVPTLAPKDVGKKVPPPDIAPAPQKGDGVDVDATAPTSQTTTSTLQNAASSTTASAPTPAAAPPSVPSDPNKDSDKDGLPDLKEIQLGTDLNNPDTDSDGLTDGAEVNIWGTNPLKKDTDGDSFPDGQEVMNGFNPKGSGKLQ